MGFWSTVGEFVAEMAVSYVDSQRHPSLIKASKPFEAEGYLVSESDDLWRVLTKERVFFGPSVVQLVVTESGDVEVEQDGRRWTTTGVPGSPGASEWLAEKERQRQEDQRQKELRRAQEASAAEHAAQASASGDPTFSRPHPVSVPPRPNNARMLADQSDAIEHAYEVLQVPLHSAPDVVRTAYAAGLKQYHPGMYRNHPADIQRYAEDRLSMVMSAYRTLCDLDLA